MQYKSKKWTADFRAKQGARTRVAGWEVGEVREIKHKNVGF
jgi:hypothetical protein